MAKYTVTYSCGHTGTEVLFGPTKDRTRKIDWMEHNKLCLDCYKKKRDTTPQKPTSILRVIPGQDPDSIIPALQKKMESEKHYRELNQQRIDSFLKDKPEGDRAEFMAGKLHYGSGSGEADLFEIRKHSDNIRRIENDIKRVQAEGKKPPILEIAVINSFTIKDDLKQRGYHFDSDGYWNDFLGLKTTPAWVKRIIVDDDRSNLKLGEEILYLKSVGMIKSDTLFNQLMGGVREGCVVVPQSNTQNIKQSPTQKAAYPYSVSPQRGERQLSVKRGKTEVVSAPKKKMVPITKKATIIRVQANRTPQAVARDQVSTSRRVYRAGTKRARHWITNPGKSDIRGVDTKRSPGPRIQRGGTISHRRGKRVPGTISK
jgi:hypothetical protein